MPKKKAPLVDGLGPDNLKRIHAQVRQAWQWSHAWRLAKKRALWADGFYRCESPDCPSKNKPVPKVSVDHVNPVGEVGGPFYIQRMFVPSSLLQCLCAKCHAAKTKIERAAQSHKD